MAGIESVGLGADFDGVKDLPLGLEDVSTYPILLARLLEEPDWTVKDIKMLAGLEQDVVLTLRKPHYHRDSLQASIS